MILVRRSGRREGQASREDSFRMSSQVVGYHAYSRGRDVRPTATRDDRRVDRDDEKSLLWGVEIMYLKSDSALFINRSLYAYKQRAYKEIAVNMPIIQVRRVYILILAFVLRCTEVHNEAIAPESTVRCNTLFASQEVFYRSPSLYFQSSKSG